MPFIEIKQEYSNWGKINKSGISIPKKLRAFLPRKTRVYYDEEKKLIGLESSKESGYTFNNERINCRKMPSETYGRFEAFWDKDRNMIIIDLSKPVEE